MTAQIIHVFKPLLSLSRTFSFGRCCCCGFFIVFWVLIATEICYRGSRAFFLRDFDSEEVGRSILSKGWICLPERVPSQKEEGVVPVVMYLTRTAPAITVGVLVHSHSQRVTLVFLVPLSENNQEETQWKKRKCLLSTGFVVLVTLFVTRLAQGGLMLTSNVVLYSAMVVGLLVLVWFLQCNIRFFLSHAQFHWYWWI